MSDSTDQHRDLSVRRLLSLARAHLETDVAWISQFEGPAQVFTHVEAEKGALGPQEGSHSDLVASYCARVVDGRLPRIVTNARTDLRTRDLPITEALGIGSYVGTPLRTPDGAVRGMLCCTSGHADPLLGSRDLSAVELLGRMLVDLLAEDDEQRATEERRRARVEAAVAGVGRHHVLQPIVDVDRGTRIGVEALARFDDPPQRPDAWFAEAQHVGLANDLEIAAARTALASLGEVGDGEYVSVNLSPTAVLDRSLVDVLDQVDVSRVVVELTEHTPVRDYPSLTRALGPYRAAGLRLAIDDTGAGYASFRHILNLQPDHIKIDMSLVRQIDEDVVKQSLVASLRTFCRDIGAAVIAEGVETQAELDTLADLGITHMQGFLLGRPAPTATAATYPQRSRRSGAPLEDRPSPAP